ncbi:catalase family protein [Sphingomonas sp. AP4-R1]|uniref:catalase family protein n=1 Tax=Sphingomonas sp. AP4-R1 TaxID=2735134 RepID=UPI0014936CF2|nr:catalase family protein [Sphingomonas sp. AP4-R1]QJU59208.1 catalase family protein [Sphingomonas sp. AP4-R1]
MSIPVRFAPDVEKPAPDEAETIAGLNEQFRIILDKTSQDYGHAVRSVHAKGHGLARGRIRVHDGLPRELAQGLFADAGEYDAILRFSTNAGDILDDSITLPRGVALKVMGVRGERLPDAEGETQDFILVNGPAFAAPDPKAFLANLKMLARTTDKAEGAKKMLSAFLRTAEAALEAVGGSSTLLNTLGGAKPYHPLGQTYFSQTPFRYGEYIAKFQLVPVSGIRDFKDETINASGRPDAIREAMNELLVEQGGTWDLRVQLNTDLKAMPIEDASVVWSEEDSPFVTVATISVPAQIAWEHPESERTEDALAFSPWHGLAAHQPLGGVNRARKTAYEFSASYRGSFNGCPVHEPAGLSDL